MSKKEPFYLVPIRRCWFDKPAKRIKTTHGTKPTPRPSNDISDIAQAATTVNIATASMDTKEPAKDTLLPHGVESVASMAAKQSANNNTGSAPRTPQAQDKVEKTQTKARH